MCLLGVLWSAFPSNLESAIHSLSPELSTGRLTQRPRPSNHTPIQTEVQQPESIVPAAQDTHDEALIVDEAEHGDGGESGEDDGGEELPGEDADEAV